MTRPSADDLAHVDDPAWPSLAAMVAQRPDATVLPVDLARARRTLEALQVTARSVLGALALHTGGLLADHGWFRLLGGGSDHLDDLASANGLDDPHRPEAPPFLVVGYDVLGGRFAIDGGGLGVSPGEVCYLGPDTLTWDGLGGGHSDLVHAAVDGTLGATFAALRWPGWQDDVAALRPDEGLALYPPPFTTEGRDVATASRRAVPMRELTGFYDDCIRQLADVDR